jgi:hypothetical protein
MIVDTFNKPETTTVETGGKTRTKTERVPAAAAYLDRLYREGPDDARPFVEVIVLTHFHLDHYQGVLALHDKYKAKLVVTDAAKHEKFQAIFAEQGPKALKEVGAAIKNAHRQRSGPTGSVSGIKLASVGKRIVAREKDGVLVLALAPSEAATYAAVEEMAMVISNSGDAAAITSQLEDDNRTSIALHVTACGQTALLCGDVVKSPRIFGWAAVVENEDHWQLALAELVKVAHHGSPTADYPPMWESMVHPGSPMLLAPYWTSTRPNQSDQARLAQRGALFQTGPSNPRFTNEWAPTSAQPARTGAVQARRRPGQDWRIGLGEPAHQCGPTRSTDDGGEQEGWDGVIGLSGTDRRERA